MSHKTNKHSAKEYIRYEGKEVIQLQSAVGSTSISIAARRMCIATLPSSNLRRRAALKWTYKERVGTILRPGSGGFLRFINILFR